MSGTESASGLIDMQLALKEYGDHRREAERNEKKCEKSPATGLLGWMSFSRCVVPKKTEPTENAASAQATLSKPK